MPSLLQSLVGLVALPLIALALSEQRGALAHGRAARMALAGIAMQVVLAGLLLNLPALRAAFDWPGRAVDALQAATLDGVRLVFGYLAGGPSPFEAVHPEHGFVLALQALPLILVISVLSKLLYHWGVLPRIVAFFALLLERSMGIGGPVATGAAANVFVGMVEAPLLIRPYLAGMSRAGLFATMTVGMAGIAGTVLAVYASVLKAAVPGVAGHLIVASVMSVPAALVIAYLMVPETEAEACAASPSRGGVRGEENPGLDRQGAPPTLPRTHKGEGMSRPTCTDDDAPHSSMDAIAQGTREGLELFANVAAMLIVAVALVSLANMILGGVSAPFGLEVTLQKLLGWGFAPLAWLIGIPWSECGTAGSLLGVKTVLNEFVAYLQLAALPTDALSERSRLIMTYALCGFANLGSLGILIGGLVSMAPSRRAEIVELGPKTVVAGTLATLMTAAVVGIVAPLSGH
jgi:CNT family concentrative nucleoside transporter